MTTRQPDAAPEIPLLAANRRNALKLGLLGLFGAGTAGPAAAMQAKGFTHGVASGEPGPAQVLLWTRYLSDQETALKWELADDAEFIRIAAAGDC